MSAYTYKICTFSSEPWITCRNDTFPHVYGFHIDIFRDVAMTIGMAYSFQCLEQMNFSNQLYGRTSSEKCDAFIGVQNANPILAQQFQMSVPLLWSGIGVLVGGNNTIETPGIFAFMTSFSLDLWIFGARL